jgi:hypothetical protein
MVLGYSNMDKVKLTKENLKMCIWILFLFQRCKLVLDNIYIYI